MQLGKGSSHYKPMSAITLYRRPISKTTRIYIETEELILKYYKLPDQLLKLHINPPGGGGMQLIEHNRTARKQEDWKNEYLHSALNTCIN